LFNGRAVGLFGQFPSAPGRYRYEPYRGLGHYEMQKLLHAGGAARCHYDVGERRVAFTVKQCPEYGVLELDEFQMP
jgi:hypothetical protein